MARAGLCALALALMIWAPAGAQVVAKADMLSGKLVPASSDPGADIRSAQAIVQGLEKALAGRDPRCLTPAEAAQLDQMAQLLDALRTAIDTKELGWTGSGFMKHGDIPEHGPSTTAEAALDALKASYWDLRGRYEKLRWLKPCTPAPKAASPPAGAGTPGPPTGGTSTAPTGGATTPAPLKPPEPPEDVPAPPTTDCRTAADDTYIADQTAELDHLIVERLVKYNAMAIREAEIAAAQDPTNERFKDKSVTDLRALIDGDKRDIEQEKLDIAALDASIFATRANLAAERKKPPCAGQPQTGATPGVGEPEEENLNVPPLLPDPPPGKCRTKADDAYEQDLKAILDRALADRGRLYGELAPLLVEQRQLGDAIEAATDEPAKAALRAQYDDRLTNLGRTIDQIQKKIEALDVTIHAAEERLKNRKAPCENNGSSMAPRPPGDSANGELAAHDAESADDGGVLKGVLVGIRVRVQPGKGPNRTAGDDGSGDASQPATATTTQHPDQTPKD
ncbi:MAG: hypothetical protein ACHP7N_02860 [Caulobacterales bacterium]